MLTHSLQRSLRICANVSTNQKQDTKRIADIRVGVGKSVYGKHYKVDIERHGPKENGKYTARLLRGSRLVGLGTKIKEGPISGICDGKYEAMEALLEILEDEEQAKMEKKPEFVFVSKLK